MLDCEKIYVEYSDKVYSYLRSHINNQEDTEDLHSHIFQKIVLAAPTYRGNPEAVSSFVYTITRNSTINFIRGRHSFCGIDAMEELETLEEGAESSVIKKETLESLAHAIKRLSPEERSIILHCYYQNMSLRETALKLSISYGICKNLHRAALKKLKDMLDE